MVKFLSKKHSISSLYLLILLISVLSIVFLVGIFLIENQETHNGNLLVSFFVSASILLIVCGIILWFGKNTASPELITVNKNQSENLLAEDLENEKKYFAGILSHDLRSPLSSIVLLASYIKSKDENPETLRYIDLVEQSARKELEMMTTLLALMRAESFKADYVEEFKLDQVIKEILQNADPQLAKKSLKATVDITPNLSLFADPQNLKLIFKSLISQAICYSDTDQSIEIKALQDNKRIVIDVAVSSEELRKNDDTELFRSDRLAVQNTGNAFPDCIHLYFLSRAIRHYNGTVHVQRDENNPASRFILTLERQPPQYTA